MKASTEIDWVGERVSVQVDFGSREEAARAVDAVKNAAHTLWPDIVFFEEDAPGAEPAPKRPRKARDYSRAPDAAGLHGRILAHVRGGGLPEKAAIAKAFKIETAIAAMALSALRRGGHLGGRR